MQTLTFYVNAESTLGAVRDYANAHDKPFSHLGGVSECKHYEQLNDNYDYFDPLDVGTWF